jgi:LysR family hydrogen peroxide-inducible transcriptional activator
MDLKQLRYVVAVAERGSFSRAAEAAFVTQPTLSAAIGALENELGAPLFERGRAGAKTTPTGERFLAHAKAVLREVEAARAEARRREPVRPLRIGLSTTVPWARVAVHLGRLVAALDGAPWRLEAGTPAEIDEALASGRIDLALSRIGRTKGTQSLALFEDEQGLAMPATERPRALTPRFLDGKRLIVRTHCEHLFAASRILDRWRVRPQVVLRTAREDHALDLVAAGLGYCLMPTSFARPGVAVRTSPAVALKRRVGLTWTQGGWGGKAAALAEAFRRN